MKKALLISASVLILTFIIAATQIPAEPVTADATSVSSDADFQLNGTTLVKYTGTAKTVSVPASVTAIGEEAFADNTAMETLLFKGDAVETIAYRAFAGCTGLKEVKLPDSVQELGNGAFSNCTALTKVTLGNKLHKLGIGSFAGCSALKDMTVAKENTDFTVEDGCLYNSDKTKLYLMLPGREKDTYTMPSTVTDIAEYAFWGCNNVKKIDLSSNLKTIPDYSFANCKSLEEVTIPYSVTSIGLKAFADCVNLKRAVIPSTVEYIHDTAFDGCSKLVIAANEGTFAYQYYQEWKEKNPAEYEDTVVSDNTVDNIDNTHENVSGADSIEEQPVVQQENTAQDVLGSTHVVGNRAVVFIDNTSQTVQNSAEEPAGNGVTQSQETDNSVVIEGAFIGEEIPKYIIADGILADQAYYKSKAMTGYQIPGGITEIGEFSFARSNLSTADIPDGVTTIDYGAFYHCDFLREVDIPASVTDIAPKAFTETMWLNNWLAGNGEEEYLVVGDGILLAYRGDGGNLVLPDTVKRIAPEVFANNANIVSVSLPDSLIEIGEDAFYGCRNLKTVSGGSNVQAIRDGAFSGCAIETAHVWENVKYLGLNSFDFSGTTLSASNKVVVFDNKETLPVPSHEETAERLSNEQARGMLLGDTVIAIVDKGMKAEELADTVLASDAYGFKGIVAYISSHDKGIVTCLATTYTEEEFTDAYIPSYITIDGKSYQVTGKENITVFGEDKNFSVGNIRIQNESAKLASADVSAQLEGNNGSYYLKLTDSVDAYDTLNRGYEAVYQEKLPASAVCVDISLIDEKSGVPITKTGRQALRITLTLPEALSGSLHIYTTDRNGQLESLAYTREGNTITFETNHLSAFAFCGV
ncbi:MAG: leucine-rich repeat domain-containing protein [Lachnospiraceae bacterium]